MKDTVTDVLHVVVPDSTDDPLRPSGGNVYDRRLCTELQQLGWTVREHLIPGAWPRPSAGDEARLSSELDAVDGPVLIDGLIASAAPTLVSEHAGRLRVVVLVHLPLGVDTPAVRSAEGAMLRAVHRVVTTSAWTRAWLAEHEGVPSDRVRVAVPGSDPADLAPGTPYGDEILCVGAVTPGKGPDVLLDALDQLVDLPWRCTWVGSLDVDPEFAGSLMSRAVGLGGRVAFTGPLDRDDVDAAYRSADVLVLPSRAETYGMVATEALARGLPVIASAVGGVLEALAVRPTDGVPGMLVPPGDAAALALTLRTWIEKPTVRARARSAARARRLTLPSWTDTAATVAESILSSAVPTC